MGLQEGRYRVGIIVQIQSAARVILHSLLSFMGMFLTSVLLVVMGSVYIASKVVQLYHAGGPIRRTKLMKTGVYP